MLILTFLTEAQVFEINKKVYRNKSTHGITSTLGNLTPSQKAIVSEHIRSLKYPREPTGCQGAKIEPYMSEEQMLNDPTYSWEQLSKNEKKFYKEYNEKAILPKKSKN